MSFGSAFSYILVGSTLPGLLKSVYRKRDRLVQKRVDLNILKRDCVHQRNHNRAAYEAYYEAAEHLASQADNPDSLQALQSAWQELQRSNVRREEQEEKLRQAANAANVLEDELKEEEETLYSELRKFNGPSQLNSPDGSQRASSPQRSYRDESPSHEPPILREYVNKNQRASFLRDQLHEFQAEHREEIQKRKLDKELNRLVAPSEKSFLEGYFEKLMAMYQDYYTTKREARALKLKCRELRLEIEDGEDDMSDIDAIEAPVAVDRQLFHFAATNRSKYKGVNPLEVLLFGYTDNTARVSTWLTGVHQNWPNSHQRTQTQNDTTAEFETMPSEDLVLAESASAIPSPNLIRSDESSFRAVEESIVAEGHAIDSPFFPRQTSFPGEAPKRRYSNPTLFQRALETLYLPRLPRRRPRSTS
jgi:hypothetical protein